VVDQRKEEEGKEDGEALVVLEEMDGDEAHFGVASGVVVGFETHGF